MKLQSYGLGLYSRSVNELDEFWAATVRARLEEARAAGHNGASEYLALRASNDAIRSAGVEWLVQAVIDAAFAANEPLLKVERLEPHGFAVNGGHATGVCVSATLGIRRFTAEAGWARTPGDGFIRGGGLAVARLSHFGMPKAGEILKLVAADDAPSWIEIEGNAAQLTTARLQRHIDILCGR